MTNKNEAKRESGKLCSNCEETLTPYDRKAFEVERKRRGYRGPDIYCMACVREFESADRYNAMDEASQYIR